MKNLFIILFLATAIRIQAQSEYYDRKGYHDIQCGNSYVLEYTDGYSTWYRQFRDCKQTVWERNYHIGYVYEWNGMSYDLVYRKGYYWSYYWNYYTEELF